MAKQVQHRRGTEAQVDAFIGADGEITVDSDTGRLRTHDGNTAGGVRHVVESDLGTAASRDVGTAADEVPTNANVARVVTSIDDLRDITPSTSINVRTLGHTDKGDGGGGDWYAVTGASASTYTDNNGTIIVPTGGDGSEAWLRVLGDYVTPMMFGAKGDYDKDTDSGSNDYDAFDAAVADCHEHGRRLHIGPGDYLLDGPLIEINSIRVSGSGAESTILYKGQSTLDDNFIKFTGCLVTDIGFDGNKENITGYATSNDKKVGSLIILDETTIRDFSAVNSESSCVANSAASNVNIEGAYLSGWDDHAVYFSTASRNIKAKNIILGEEGTTAARAFQFRSGCQNILVENVFPEDESYSYEGFALVSNDTQDHGDTENVLFRNCRMNVRSALYIFTEYDNRYVRDVTFERCNITGDGTHRLFNGQHSSYSNLENIRFLNCELRGFTELKLNGTSSSYRIKGVVLAGNVIGLTATVNIGQIESLTIEDNVFEFELASSSALFNINLATAGVIIKGNRISDERSVTADCFNFAANGLDGDRQTMFVRDNFIDISGAVLASSGTANSPRGIFVYRDNFEYEVGLDTIDSSFDSYIEASGRIRQSALGAATVNSGVVR